MRFAERLLRRMHEPLQRYPEKSPVLSALLAAFAAGLESFDARAAQRAMYLDSARGRWLSEWAELYAYERAGKSDAELYQEMREQTILERRKTTAEAVIAAARQATGLEIELLYSQSRSYHFDQVERMASEYAAFDYTVLIDGREEGERVDFFHRGSRALLPESREWGAGGLLVIAHAAYDPELEKQLCGVLERQLKAGANFVLSWQARARLDIADMLELEDETTKPDYGWGIDSWGSSTWG